MTQYNISNLALDPVVNFGKVTVSTGYTNLDTIIVLSPGNGAKLPNPSVLGPFNLVWWNSTDYSDPSDDPNVEIVRCTDNTLDVLTVIREQEGILKSNKNIPTKTYKMILSPTKKTITDIPIDTQSRVNSSISIHADLITGVHGAGASTIETIAGSQNKVNTHKATDVSSTVHPNANTHIVAAAPHSGHDTPGQRDAAISTAIDNHKNLITGVHGVTGSYILGTEDIGVINGVAGLDSSGKVPTSQLPGLALTNVYTVADQTAQLALNATTQEGDVAIRTDQNKSYVRNAGVSGTMADWSLLLTPTDVVTSVFGRTGVVATMTNDYTWAQINKTISNIADITTRSHTLLTDIGTYSHATIDSHMTSAAGVHGVTGTVVGTSDAQALTNKTIKTTVGLQLPVGINQWVT